MWPFRKKHYLRLNTSGGVVECRVFNESDECFEIGYYKYSPLYDGDRYTREWIRKNNPQIIDTDRGILRKKEAVSVFPLAHLRRIKETGKNTTPGLYVTGVVLINHANSITFNTHLAHS
jgi:hypothetical protein